MNRKQSRHTRSKPIYPKAPTLYRNLLKQARRLPDPASRYFFQTQIRNKFQQSKGHRFSLVGSTIQPSRNVQLNTALYHLIRLSRANLGSGEDLEFIVGVTYGLIGPVIAEREKYRRLLNFRPSDFRFHPFPEPNPSHITTLAQINTQQHGDALGVYGIWGRESQGMTEGSSPNSNNSSPPPTTSSPKFQLSPRLKQLITYENVVKNDETLRSIFTTHPASSHLTTSPTNRTTQSIPTHHALFNPGQSDFSLDAHSSVHYAQHPSQSFTNDPKQSTTHHQSLNNIQHLKTMQNPLSLSPYVYTPFRYGQYIQLHDIFSPTNAHIVKRNSQMQKWRNRLRRIMPKTNPSTSQTSTNQLDKSQEDSNITDKLPLLKLHPEPEPSDYNNPLPLHDSTAFVPPITTYTSKTPVHPRVQLSFDYQLDHFMFSILYFLSTQPVQIRNAFRAWPDFGWVPLEQEAYDRIFGLEYQYDETGRLLDPRSQIQRFLKEQQSATSTPTDGNSKNDSDKAAINSSKISPQLLADIQFNDYSNELEKNLHFIEMHKKRNAFTNRFGIPPAFRAKIPIPPSLFKATSDTH